jgi:hypothetical protein
MRCTRAYLAAAAAVVLSLAGCTNPDTSGPVASRLATPASPGEPAGPPAPSVAAQRPTNAADSPQRAIEQFAALYTNWTYRTLPTVERKLAAISVDAARLQETQAAVSARNQQLARGRVWNDGVVVAVARDRDRPGWWVVVTREQTGGEGEYAGLPTTYHLTLAQAVPAAGGWSVSEWQPQN